MRHASHATLEDVLRTFFRHKNRVLLVMLLSTAVTAVWLAFEQPVYVAETRLLMRVGKEKLSGIESLAKDSYNIMFQERGQDIHNGIEVLKDPRLAYAVYERLRPVMQPPVPPKSGVARIKYEVKHAFANVKHWMARPLYWVGLKTELSPDEEAVLALRQALQIRAVEDSDVILLAFAWTDPQFAAMAVNAFSKEFLAKYIRVDENDRSEGFYREQIDLNQKSLTEAEAALAKFRSTYGITNLPLQKELLLRESLETEARLNEATMRVQEYKAMREGVTSDQATGGWIQTPEERQHPVADLSTLDKQYYDLVARRNQLAATMGEGHPELREIGPRMAQLRRSKAQNLLAAIGQKLNAAAQERATLNAQLHDKRARLAVLDEQTAQMGELERARTAAENNFITYKKKGEELRVSDQLSTEKIGGARLVSEAKAPVQPAGPKRGLMLGLAALIGLFLGLGFSAIAEYFNHTFRDEKDVEGRLGERVLMIMPALREAQA